MKVLLTGASGFLGRYVLLELIRRGIETVVVGRGRPDGFDGEFISADLLEAVDFCAIHRHVRATHLLHLAWYAEHGKYWTSPLNLRWVEASVRLVESFCAEGGEKVVVAGTCAEYDWSVGYCQEDVSPLVPATLYGTSKDATRRLVTAICSANRVPCAWGRIFMPYGRGEDVRRLIPSLVDVFRKRRDPFGVNGAAYRDLLHVEDVANGFLQLLASNANGSFNISSGHPVQIASIVRLIAGMFNANADDVLGMSSARPGEPALLVGDNRKLRLLGWHPVHDSFNQAGLELLVAHS